MCYMYVKKQPWQVWVWVWVLVWILERETTMASFRERKGVWVLEREIAMADHLVRFREKGAFLNLCLSFFFSVLGLFICGVFSTFQN